MKTYNNGPRKGMMYGGAARRKPMMYGGMAKKPKPRKKAQMGGMMSATPSQMAQDKRKDDMIMNTAMGMPRMGMAKGGEPKTVPADNPGLKKLPKPVRNKMGYMMYGGMAKKKKR